MNEKTTIYGTKYRLISVIKEKLKTNFSVTIWTEGLTDEQIMENSNNLNEAGVTHYYDKVMNAILCFRSKEDMNYFKKELEKYV